MPQETPRRRRAAGQRPPRRATVAALAPSTPRHRALGRTRQYSLGPRPRFEFGDEVFQPQTSRRLDFADARQEFLFIERLPCPFHDFGRNRLARERFRLIRLIGFHRLLLRGSISIPPQLYRIPRPVGRGPERLVGASFGWN